MENKNLRRKPGPLPGPPTRQYVVLLEEEPAEWGKRQPGGLSALLRKLLRNAWETASGETGPDPAGARKRTSG